MWQEGCILIPTKGGNVTVKYQAKVYDEGSRYGINNGRISKLMLRSNGRVIYSYDRGEDIEPQNEAAEIALAILLEEYK